MAEEGLLMVYTNSKGEPSVGVVIGRTTPSESYPDGQIVIKELVKFKTLEALEQHAFKILAYIKKRREGGIPEAVIEAFNEEEKGEG